MRLVLKGGRILDPANGVDREGDLVIESGLISGIAEAGAASGDEVRDCRGLLVTPGFIDLHVHLREPGFEYKEDIESGTRAAAAGGFTAVCCMPNTRPAIDTAAVVRQIAERAAAVGSARVYPVAALTRDMAGDQLTEVADLRSAGAVAVSDDAFPLQNAETMRRAMEYCAQLGTVVMTHNEDQSLTAGGAMNEGYTATVMGMPGIPAVAEDIVAARNIVLAGLTGCRLHLLHISTAGTAELLRRAKADGLPVTGETCPHYLTLTDAACEGFRTNAKMNPPLRTDADVAALRAAVADGTIDAIATDHAPHAAYEKEQEFDRAPFGILGLETAFAVIHTHLVRTDALSLDRAIWLLTAGPAHCLGLPGGSLCAGSPADVAVLDLGAAWRLDPESLRSRSRNTPYAGSEFAGRAVFTVLGGRVIDG
ncbi:MAG TPA: dihydroorotase [Chthonomonadales bacterium]|nr:dihydroorotase [Chthonomonadales bacterium]